MSMFNIIRKEFQYGQHTVVLETGRVARQANTVVITMGGVQVLVAIVAQPKAKVQRLTFGLRKALSLQIQPSKQQLQYLQPQGQDQIP